MLSDADLERLYEEWEKNDPDDDDDDELEKRKPPVVDLKDHNLKVLRVSVFVL